MWCKTTMGCPLEWAPRKEVADWLTINSEHMVKVRKRKTLIYIGPFLKWINFLLLFISNCCNFLFFDNFKRSPTSIWKTGKI
ncbi:hypothetical protein Pint_30665 [Pistacia integerrima]|uniref:Uncharacterized protein n=1 Tax=Pistacia integerrima TaxID=434235 RepID=A0ACC0X1S6_9ROSI|nr:hypothetical protein Pint_30665 [Pistacia integerrima]